LLVVFNTDDVFDVSVLVVMVMVLILILVFSTTILKVHLIYH
jgi:hypothetical protein